MPQLMHLSIAEVGIYDDDLLTRALCVHIQNAAGKVSYALNVAYPESYRDRVLKMEWGRGR